MKHNWEYKKWDDVLRIINGKNQKAVENPTGKYPIYGSGGIISYADEYLCPENCTIIGRKGSINNPIYVKSKFWNVDTAFGLCANQECVLSRYLYFFCVHYDFMKHNKATTLPSLVKADLLKILMPVPPMETQEQIVAELDKLHEMIATRKEQLKELDNLAQSLFYDTFGDPLTNPMNWTQKSFSKCFRLKSGDGLSTKEVKEGPYPVYGGNGIVGHHIFSNLGGLNLIIGRVGALCGNVRLVSGDIFVTDNAFITYFLHDFNHTFALYLLTILNLRQYAKAVAQPVISNLSLQNIPIIIPHLPLQQQFANQVEAIEKQKEMVEASIAELKTLLDSRMDYWFN